MKVKSLLVALLVAATTASAQTADPTIMTINGKAVPRSEFEYSYNKNNSETVVDKKSVNEYIDLFVNYKLKVMAAEEAGIDTTKAFRDEFRMYRDQQIRPSFINDNDVEREARTIYEDTRKRIDGNGGLVRPRHILVSLKQNATKAQSDSALVRADSIYNALIKGADFAELAQRCSDDKGSARRGGDLSWVQRGYMVKEFEDAIFAMKPGEISKPILSPFGYHIIKVEAKQNFFPYDTVRADIHRFIESRGLRERIISQNIDSIAKHSVPQCTPEDILNRRADEMTAADPALKNLIREYHDGLLLYEISNRTVWDKAAKDEEVKEFEDAIFAMKPGEISKPILSPFGYHIIKVEAKQNFFPYDTVRADIHRFIESRGLRERIISQNIDSIAKHSVPQCTPEDILNRRADEMTAADPALKNLIREYHDGLLLYEISNRTVWDKAAKDEEGLAAYFKKNRKRYKWEQPRFKGIAYWVKQEGDVEAVKKSLKNIPFEKWAERLRKEFNDSTIRIKVVKGIFREGDNALIDKVVFAKDTTVADVKDFPISATYGEKLKAPKTYNDVRELVVADYQEQLEKAWIEALRKRYTVVVNKDVLSTVNKH